MDLRPPVLDDMGLLPMLSWFCRRFQTVYSTIRTEPEIGIQEGEIPDVLKIVIYRLVQEAMNNIAKHSKADLVRISLQKMDGRLEVTIRDNGRGFNLEEVISKESAEKGLGLSSMRERTTLSGGTFSVESDNREGTAIRASWPFEGQ
jgi:signal transduction histidine kinase